MAAYIIAEIEVTDPQAYEKYRARTPEAVARHGGRFIVRGGKALLLEGGPEPARLVILEFADMEAAKRFYDSPDYREILPLRQQASKGRLVLVEGA
jgi:uncharacterized protein (DUF1330 family)